jgi:hypothetical protein
MSYRFTADDMGKLNDAQKDMIIDVIIAGVLADGQVQEAEVSTFDTELRKVPWGRTEAEMEDKIKQSIANASSMRVFRRRACSWCRMASRWTSCGPQDACPGPSGTLASSAA